MAVVDGDRIGHRVLEETTVRDELQRRFGESIVDRTGQINRQALARTVFGSSEDNSRARAELEEVVHPRIEQELARQIAEARHNPETEAVIVDAAVLLEAGWNSMCDAVVFVDVSEEQRMQRVRETRGWDAETFRSRESSQMSLQDKHEAADYVISNAGSLDEAEAGLNRVLDEILERGRQG